MALDNCAQRVECGPKKHLAGRLVVEDGLQKMDKVSSIEHRVDTMLDHTELQVGTSSSMQVI